MRKIIHVDMDAFYASVEQRDFPGKYAGKPIAGGGKPPHGVVMTASYEARAAGDVYRAVSRRVREVFARYTDLAAHGAKATRAD